MNAEPDKPSVSEEHVEKLLLIQREYPELTLNNQGYEYLDPKVRQAHRSQIKEITSIIKEFDPGIVEFNNFKPRAHGGLAIRYQSKWDESFIGVTYVELLAGNPARP